MITIYSTLAEYFLFWNSPACTPSLSDITRAARRRIIRNYYIPCLGGVTLSQYELSHVRLLRDYLAQVGAPESMRYKALCVFRVALREAERRHLIPRSFHESFHIDRAPAPMIHIYTPEELQQIFQVLDGDPLRNYYRLILYTGIESAEALGLRISDIDLPNRTMTIHQRLLGASRTECILSPLEPRQRRRKLYLSNPAMACVADELRRNAEKRSRRGWRDKDLNLLFTNHMGLPILKTRTAETRKAIQARTGIDHFSIAALRFTAADILFKSGATEKVVQDYLGYTSLGYVYSLKNRLQRSGINDA